MNLSGMSRSIIYLYVLLCDEGNWRKSLEDSLEAQKLDPDNIKAYFRCAKAAMQLGRYEVCQQQCQVGIARRIDAKTAQQFSTLAKVMRHLPRPIIGI